MRSPSFTILKVIFAIVFVVSCAVSASAASVAILDPNGSSLGQQLAEELAQALKARGLKVTDPDIAASAYRAASPETPFNMTADAAKRLGAVIGSDFFILIKPTLQRRNSSSKKDYFEAYAAIYVVSSRTGHLVDWKIWNAEDRDESKAAKSLVNSTSAFGSILANRMEAAARDEVTALQVKTMEEPPDADSALAKNFKAPIPFRRIKPEYTAVAAFYEVAATVEMVIDLDEKGIVMRTEIVRWAGFGLDGAVEKAVREMNWRPAERDGRFLPMRFLVRYNFKKIDKTN
jgi:hypothetical protein